MVKLMAKKSKVLGPSAHCSLEEWHAQVLARHGHAHPALLLTPHTAALRIQLRYRVYKEKVRSLLKKTSEAVKDEHTGDGPTTNGSLSAKAKGLRGAKSSSMALAVAYKTHKDAPDADVATVHLPHAPRKASGLPYGPPDVASRVSIQDAATQWHAAEWAAPKQSSNGFVPASMNAVQAEKQQNPQATSACEAQGDAPLAGAATHDHQLTSNDLSDEERGVPHSFVDVMHSSWLLSTMEDRCAQAAASLGARGTEGSHKELTILDIRHTVLDLLFICRSGQSENLHGRKPSSTSTHHQNLIERLARDETSSLDEEAFRRVRKIFDSLKSDMVLPAVRCLGWMLTKTWRMLFNGLHVDVESLYRVRQALEAAGNVSVVFTPTHKTHLDYLIISYLCFAYGIPLPRIAAGNNLDLPVIGPFLRANGSFFIRRSFKNDPLYKQVLQHYVHELLRDGNPIEVFIEGGRSRHGRVCKPRLGFLSMFLDYAHDPTVDGKDVLLVPISLDYDRVFEVEEYANQLLGKPKEKESLKVFFQSIWDLLFLRCGHCYVRFGEPMSIQAKPKLADTAQDLAVRMQKSGTITSTAIVSAVLMWARQYSTREMVQCRAEWLSEELVARGATIAHMLDTESLVQHALSVLNVPVSEQGVVQPKIEFPTRALELGFYRNHLLHAFLPDMALIGTIDAMRLKLNASKAGMVSLDKAEVLANAGFLWKYLRHICRHEDVDLGLRLETLVLQSPQVTMVGDRLDIDVGKWRAARLINFVLSLHWSFLDTLWLAVLSCHALSALHVPIPERDMVRLAQVLARELFVSRDLQHAEAFCSESIKQAFEFLEETRTITFMPCPTAGSRLYSRDHVTPETESESEDSLLVLQRRVNAMRKPQSFLYRDECPPTRWDSLDAVLELVKRSMVEVNALAKHPRSRGGVYAKWMSH